MTMNHQCQMRGCPKWGSFGERLPDVPEADFPTRWYCRDHLPVDYYDGSARDRLRAAYRPKAGMGPDRNLDNKQGALFDL